MCISVSFTPEFSGVKETEMHMHPYLTYWYAGTYVVIEGWRELGLSDTEIDALLASPNVELLRRSRNGAFHFQRRYYDERFTDFWGAPDSAAWLRALREALSRWFLSFFKEHEPKAQEG